MRDVAFAQSIAQATRCLHAKFSLELQLPGILINSVVFVFCILQVIQACGATDCTGNRDMCLAGD